MSVEGQDLAALKGEFLIAMPTLNDPNFSRTVVCICEFSSEGALGMIINRLYSSFVAKDLFEELNMEYIPAAESLPIHNGGPVNMGDVFVLHGPPFHWLGCHPVTPWLALTNTRDVLEAIARGEGPESFLIIMGCSGWGGGQLEMELKGNFWLTAQADAEVLFRTPVEKRWAKGMALINIDPTFLSESYGNA